MKKQARLSQNSVSFVTSSWKKRLTAVFSIKSKVAVPKTEVSGQPKLFFAVTVLCLAFIGCEAMADLFHGPKAKPAPETYTVTFDANGATNETAPQPIPAIKGSAITLPNEGGLSIDGHTFGGWNANAAGTGDHYTAGSPYTVNGDVTLYAKWNPVLYTVIFDPNGATSGTAPQPIPAIKGSAITLPNEGGPNEGGLSMDGNAFVGWNTNTAGTGNNHSAGSSYTVNEDVTLYAKWNKVLPEERIVRFFTNGGSSVDTQIIETGKTATRPADPDKTGNNFGNWYEEPELITVYDFSTPVFVHINLYAKWNPVLYTVTFNINGGSGTTPPAQTKNAGEAITLPNGDGFSRTGYTSVFGGWNTNAAGTGVNYNFGDSYTVTGDVVLYANWRPYELGETGPGGGKIFFRSGSGFTHYTSRTDTVGITCHYLEAAPANIPAGRAWASTNFLFTHMGTSTAIGTGMRNTLLILKIDITAHAAKACNEYDNNGKSDWFLPSKDELSLLYDNRVDADIVLIGWYWSSSEIDHQSAWCGYLQHNLKHHIGSVLPIRAF